MEQVKYFLFSPPKFWKILNYPCSQNRHIFYPLTISNDILNTHSMEETRVNNNFAFSLNNALSLQNMS